MSIVTAGGIVTPAWIKVTAFTNSWVSAAGFPFSYRKVGDMVFFQGDISSGTAATAFTLPVGYRPATAVNINAYFSMCVMNTNGTFVPGNTSFQHLTGMCFSTASAPP